MATLLQKGQLTMDSDFRLRVTMGLLKIAQDVLNEPTDTPHYSARRIFASSIRNSPEQMVPLFIWALASNDAIAAAGPVESEDNDIMWVIAAEFNAVAGIGI